MKNIIILGLIVIGVMVALIGISEDLFNKDVVSEVIQVEEVPAWQTDEDAIRAAEEVIQRKEWEDELNTVQSDIEALKAREAELEKELGVY